MPRHRYTVTIRPLSEGSRDYLSAFQPDELENVAVRVLARNDLDARAQAMKRIRAHFWQEDYRSPEHYQIARPNHSLGRITVCVTPGW